MKQVLAHLRLFFVIFSAPSVPQERHMEPLPQNIRIWTSKKSHWGMLEGNMAYCDTVAAAVAHCDHEN
eukprot:scaffold22545_cov61-Attheya_sp.AAC.4